MTKTVFLTLTPLLAIIILLTACANHPAPLSSSSSSEPKTPLPDSLSFFPAALDEFAGQPYPAGLSKGILFLENGLLRLKPADPGSVSQLIIWPAGFSVREENSVIEVFYAGGELAAKVGDYLELGGGQVPPEIVENLIGQTLPQNCLGPYWATGSVHWSELRQDGRQTT